MLKITNNVILSSVILLGKIENCQKQNSFLPAWTPKTKNMSLILFILMASQTFLVFVSQSVFQIALAWGQYGGQD